MSFTERILSDTYHKQGIRFYWMSLLGAMIRYRHPDSYIFCIPSAAIFASTSALNVMETLTCTIIWTYSAMEHQDLYLHLRAALRWKYTLRDYKHYWRMFISYAYSWWRHEMEAFSALLALCVGNSSVTDEFPAQRPVMRRFDVICAWINGWANIWEAGGLRRHPMWWFNLGLCF